MRYWKDRRSFQSPLIKSNCPCHSRVLEKDKFKSIQSIANLRKEGSIMKNKSYIITKNLHLKQVIRKVQSRNLSDFVKQKQFKEMKKFRRDTQSYQNSFDIKQSKKIKTDVEISKQKKESTFFKGYDPRYERLGTPCFQLPRLNGNNSPKKYAQEQKQRQSIELNQMFAFFGAKNKIEQLYRTQQHQAKKEQQIQERIRERFIVLEKIKKDKIKYKRLLES